MGEKDIFDPNEPTEKAKSAKATLAKSKPVAQTVSANTAESSSRKGLAVTALIVGCVAFLVGWVPFFGFLVGITAVVFGSIALAKKQSKGMSITGLVLGGVAALTSTIVLLGIVIGGASSVDIPDDAPAQSSAAPSATPTPAATSTPSPSPTQTKALSGREAWVAQMEADGWAEMNDKIWFKWADHESYTCDSFNCGYAFITTEEDCYSGVYVEVAIMEGDLSVGSNSQITSALYLDGNTLPMARVMFEDYDNTPNGSFKVTNIYCMDW